MFCYSARVGLMLMVASTCVAAEPASDQTKKPDRPQIEVCFVLDTTGSMGGLIQGAKDKIWSITNELLETEPAPDIRFALIAYRDRGDQYVTKRTDLTNDVDQIHTDLMSYSANGGNDTPESVNQALHESVSKIEWSESRKVLKLIFLVGDAPPHMDYDEIQYPEICELALKKDLIINTIQCGNIAGTDVVWKNIAHSSEGRYAAILQNGGTVAIKTPFDERINKLNASLNMTVCGYGDMGMQAEVASKLQSQQVAKAEAVADRAAYFARNRSGGQAAALADTSINCVVSGVDDLVTMIMDEKIKLSEIDVEKLPQELQKMDEKQREQEIQKRIKKRRDLQQELDELVKKRTTFLKAEKAKLQKESGKAGFDLQVENMIRDQAARKGISYGSEK